MCEMCTARQAFPTPPRASSEKHAPLHVPTASTACLQHGYPVGDAANFVAAPLGEETPRGCEVRLGAHGGTTLSRRAASLSRGRHHHPHRLQRGMIPGPALSCIQMILQSLRKWTKERTLGLMNVDQAPSPFRDGSGVGTNQTKAVRGGGTTRRPPKLALPSVSESPDVGKDQEALLQTKNARSARGPEPSIAKDPPAHARGARHPRMRWPHRMR